VGIGERIAEERKRLGLSQSAFASLVGVSFSSQRRYENETRAPDTAYLDSLRKHGVDVEWVLATPKIKRNYADFYQDLGEAIVVIYGITTEELDATFSAASQATEIATKDIPEYAHERHVAAFCAALLPEVAKLMKSKLGGRGQNPSVDSDMLAAVLENLDEVLSRLDVELTLTKKSKVAAMLYRAFKASGKVDRVMIEEAVKLAAG